MREAEAEPDSGRDTFGRRGPTKNHSAAAETSAEISADTSVFETSADDGEAGLDTTQSCC